MSNAYQRFEVHARVSDRHLWHAALQTIDLEIVLCGERRQTIEAVVPEVAVIDQGIEWLEQGGRLVRVALSLEGVFQLLDQMLEADRILLAFREAAMSGLING